MSNGQASTFECSNVTRIPPAVQRPSAIVREGPLLRQAVKQDFGSLRMCLVKGSHPESG
jgi:hypothetical protein